ncbi:unnamed protein product [Pieris macdunnoughi]|uniref:Uncharacterized protein n=1 Tax=Pieris macdunnoughi TaxID=345717 RepID=A0A821W9D1_9NEOP|nr:unnamed protein product [Pieris macdunnoughi]
MHIEKSARSEGESSGEQSCESSDEGVGRDAPSIQQHPQHQPMPHPHQHNLTHHAMNHQQINLNHQLQRNSPRPMEREVIKVRDDFESLKTSLHPHLSSLASLAQGAPLSTPSVFAMAGGGPGGFYAPPAFLAPAPPPPAPPAGSASSSSSEGSAAGWSFEEQYKQVRQVSHSYWFVMCIICKSF